MTVRAFAPAKVNLTLHVTGRRADGYHLLDSFVVFADLGDRVEAEPAEALSLVVDGPGADAVPAGDDNIVRRAAEMVGVPARLRLTKELPAAAGLGGGSSDAAAAIRALRRLGAPDPAAREVLALGADLPVCLAGRPARMAGIGETLAEVPPLPPAWLVLVNPRISLPTGEVFRSLDRVERAPMGDHWPAWTDAPALAGWLAGARNDLEPAACRLAPQVARTLAALRGAEECLLARMSGSGATCFGLFGDGQSAGDAAARLAQAHPGWWVRAAPILREAPGVEAV